MRTLLSLLVLSLLISCRTHRSGAPITYDTPSAGTQVTATATPGSASAHPSAPKGAPKGALLHVPGLAAQAEFRRQSDGSVALAPWSVRLQGTVIEVLLDGKVFATATPVKETWLVQRADGVALGKLQRQDDGGYKVVSPAGQTTLKVKPREYGWKVTGAKEEELGKTRVENGRIKVKDAAGQELNKLADDGEGLAYTVLSFEALPLEVRLVFSYLARGAKHG